MENATAIIGVTLTGVAMLGALLLYVIRGEITRATKPIQPDANGGRSLPDVAKAVERLAEDNQAFHQLLADRVHEVARRLDDHASSPAHDRRWSQDPNSPRRRRTDRED